MIDRLLGLMGWGTVADKLLQRLKAHGFNADHLAAAVEAYQRWHGLDVTGIPDASTIAHLSAPRFCAHPDHPGEALTQRWSRTALTYRLASLPQGMTPEHVARALAAWAAVSPLTFTRVNSGTADCIR